MKTKKEMIQEYKERPKPPAGVFMVKNTVNGKILLGSSLNLAGPLNAHKFMLTIGKHDNEELQSDWKQFGADAFVFEILEEVNVKDDPGFDVKDELTLLEQIWIEKLHPFGENGYNTKTNIRQA
jgi:group I intron endonuclease